VKTVGIIANPASGKDIRRLIASGTVVGNREKINIVVRALLAMDSLGVEHAVIMPDPSHIAERVIKQVASRLRTLNVEVLELPYLLGTARDTQRSVRRMRELGCSSIIVMGGDGTSRIASTESGDTPLIPVSTGTNNVFPQMVEGTLVGLAAAALATNAVSVAEVCERVPRLELHRNGEQADIALVDLAVVSATDSAARAVWEPQTIREVFLTHASPNNIGLSSIGGHLPGVELGKGECLHVTLGEGDLTLTVPIAPGLMKTLSISRYAVCAPGEEIEVTNQSAMIALDGEREFPIREDESVAVHVSDQGPVVLQIDKTLKLATRRAFSCNGEGAAVACA
jgi:predicted polyphosphate/ATP-dependent NAD kinase